MIVTRSSDIPDSSLSRDVLRAARHYFSGRRGLAVWSAIALVAGLAFNWSWLVAAGAVPFLMGVLPCLAMCVLGLCANKMSGRSCSAKADTSKTADSLAEDAARFVSAQAPATRLDRSVAGIENDVTTVPDPQPLPLEERRTTHA